MTTLLISGTTLLKDKHAGDRKGLMSHQHIIVDDPCPRVRRITSPGFSGAAWDG